MLSKKYSKYMMRKYNKTIKYDEKEMVHIASLLSMQALAWLE